MHCQSEIGHAWRYRFEVPDFGHEERVRLGATKSEQLKTQSMEAENETGLYFVAPLATKEAAVWRGSGTDGLIV